MAAPGTARNVAPAGEAALVRRVEDSERALRELAPSIADSFAPVIQDLQEKQAALEEQQAKILELVGTQVVFVDAWASDAGIGFSTSFTQQALCTVSIPTGYTKFTFSGSAVARAYNTTGSTVYLFAQVYSKVVGGPDAWGATAQTTIANGFQATVTAPHSATHAIPAGATQVQIWVVVSTTAAAVAAHPTNFTGVEGVAFFSR